MSDHVTGIPRDEAMAVPGAFDTEETVSDAWEPEGGSSRRGVNGRLVVGALSLVFFVGVWAVVAVVVVDNDTILPAPWAVVSAIWHYFNRPYPGNSVPIWKDIIYSTLRILVGFSAGSIIGVALGSAMAASRRLRWVIDPFIELTRPLPPLAFIPLLIVWFGIGELPKVILITVGVVPIMAVATAASLQQVPQEMLDSSRSLGASNAYTLLHVRLRAAVPFIVTAMRLALGVSWTSIVAAELIVAQAGLGYLIQQAGLFLQTSIIFSGIALIGLLGITMDGCLRLLLRRLDPAGAAR